MHAATRISTQHPQGDRGGNLVKLGKNPVAANLHSYWDKGAGSLIGEKAFKHKQIVKMASDIELNFSCSFSDMELNPSRWAGESHQLAVNVAYKIKSGDFPDKKYQDTAKKITEQRVASAGCRLAALLNNIDDNLTRGWEKR